MPSADPRDIPVVILCGGMGTRLREETGLVPKPMVTVGGQPILWHIMRYYSTFGFSRFILCLGYRSDVIKNFFLNYQYLEGSFSIAFNSVGGHAQPVLNDVPSTPPWTVSCIDTGEGAMTGARVKRIERFVEGKRFMLTYGDGLCNVDLQALLDFHEDHGKIATVTGVHPPSRFGSLSLSGNAVERFAEKSQTQSDFINGGYFVCEPEIFDFVYDSDACVFEQEPLSALADKGELRAYLHNDYWQCMDTVRDRELLEEAWTHGAPWKRW